MLIDLHVHSWLSRDCDLDPKAVLQRAESHGLDGVAFTETNTQDGCDELFDLAKKSKVKIFVGLELSTDRGQYLCFFADPLKAPEPVQMWGSNREKAWSRRRLPAEAEVARRGDRRRAPLRPRLSQPGARLREGAEDALGGRGLQPEDQRGRQRAGARGGAGAQAARGGRERRPQRLDELGYAATAFKHPVATQAELVKALTAGEYWPVQMGELPYLMRPGEARAKDTASKKKRRRWRN